MTEQVKLDGLAVACPDCGQRVDIPVTVELSGPWEKMSLELTPDLADVWAHSWTHEESE